MITKLSDFLAEKKKQQINLSKLNENTEGAEGAAQPTAEEQAVELKTLVDGVAAELGLNAATVEAEVENGIEAANEGFIDSISNAISTFGSELGNESYASFSTGIIIFLILGAATAALWTGVSIADKMKAKKALRAYLYFKYKDEIEKLSKDELKGFIVNKVKELQSNNDLMADIASKSDLYISKYGQYVTESVLSTEYVVNEFFGFGKKTYNLTSLKPSKDAVDFYNNRKDLVGRYNKFFVGKEGMTEDQAKNAIMAIYDFGNGAPLLNKYTIEFNKDTNTLVVDPNGKGLFNGHPVMG
jgi:hypothetical protein